MYIRRTLREDSIMTNDQAIKLRLPSALLARVDALVPRVADEIQMIGGRPSRSSVIRLAIARGLEAMEAERPDQIPLQLGRRS